MAKGYWAHGRCGDCHFVGDLWFVDEDGVTVGVCPDCSCTTPVDDMPEYPGEKTKKK